MNKFLFAIILFVCLSCVEKYDFNVTNKSQGVVIESFISNKSYNETLEYPSDGRYFKVRVAKLSDVDNVRDPVISEAIVKIVAASGEEWLYSESDAVSGDYYLLENDFAAIFNEEYKIVVEIPSGEIFESEWEKLPVEETEVSTIDFREVRTSKYIFEGQGEKVLKDFDEIEVFVKTPVLTSTDQPVYYRWNFDPIWTYTAPQASSNSPNRKCWIRSDFYMGGFQILKDNVGVLDQNLFSIETIGNSRVYDYFSVLVTQSVISEGYYNFWKDLLAQRDRGGLFDTPPFNLPTNFKAVNNEWSVNGYFNVVTENSVRWVFDKTKLSYSIVDDIAEICDISYGPPAPGEKDRCEDCLGNSDGESTNVQPSWW